ncbi:MAG: gliding motility protein GldL [Bacteroidales bacterium]|nr:gliding motility protein GldL [Bacteroidales bacterium]
MGKYKKYKSKVAEFLSSDKGQRFFNFAYSIGAAVVIWGALFKILHLPGGNFLLSLGMGTEVVMFILSAFDNPGKSYHWEDVFPVLATRDEEDRPQFGGGGGGGIVGGNGGTVIINGAPEGGVVGGVVGGSNIDHAGGVQVTPTDARRAVGIPEGIDLSEEDSKSLSESIQKMSAAADQLSRMAELTDATQQYLSQLAAISAQMDQLRTATESLTQVSNTLLSSYQAITSNSDGLNEQSNGYVEQMETLNRNINGLNTIYEIQLKSVSSQLDNIDRVNTGIKNISRMYENAMGDSDRYCRETEKMAQYMQQLNSVYEKMITAMTINMYHPMAATVAQAQPVAQDPEKNNTTTTEENA